MKRKTVLLSLVLFTILIISAIGAVIYIVYEVTQEPSEVANFKTQERNETFDIILQEISNAKTQDKKYFVEDQLIIKFFPGEKNSFDPAIYSIQEVKKLAGDIYLYKTTSSAPDLATLVTSMEDDEHVSYAEPNYIGEFLQAGELSEVYSNLEYNLKFSYPARLEICSQCSIAGPTDQSAENLITIGDISEDQLGSDVPFDGMALYVVENVSNYTNYILDEEATLLERSVIMNGNEPENKTETEVILGGIQGVKLTNYSWDDITRIYIPLPESENVLVIAILNDYPEISNILKSFNFDDISSDEFPNDPLYVHQWNLNNDGSLGEKDIDIDMDSAWQKDGDFEPTIAFLDSGLMLDHEDIKSNLWINEREFPDNRMDDDENGYVDDYYGYNFSDYGSGQINVGGGHGTWTSGIVSASVNNGKGIAGICGKCKLMTMQFYIDLIEDQEQNEIVASIVIEAFEYAKNMGARVINNSWTMPFYSQALQDQINNLYENDVLIIAAAGNSNADPTHPDWEYYGIIGSYPAQMDNVIAVAAIGPDGNKTEPSNYGSWVDIAAPSSQVPLLSPYNPPASYSIPLDELYSGDAYVREGDEGGTSIAAPHVTGVAGLLLTVNPDLTASELEEILLNNTKPYLDDEYYLGRGIVNADMALSAVTIED